MRVMDSPGAAAPTRPKSASKDSRHSRTSRRATIAPRWSPSDSDLHGEFATVINTAEALKGIGY